jgi:hypothetical protein
VVPWPYRRQGHWPQQVRLRLPSRRLRSDRAVSCFEQAGGGVMAELRVVDVTQEQLHALVLAVIWSVEYEESAAQCAAIRSTLASVGDRLLSVWAEMQSAGSHGYSPEVPAGGTGVA